jgi:endo-1,4-beta-xylanase
MGPTPAPIPASSVPTLPPPASAPALKSVRTAYLVGAALEPAQLDIAADAQLLRRHFNSITAENVMKPATIKGESEGQAYNFAPADQLIVFARANNMQVRGHTLVWHQSAPAWFFAGDQSDPVAYRALVRQRLRTYIIDVITYFGANVYAWDVVNEAASDTAGEIYRTSSPWYQAYSVGGLEGADYVEDAFRFAGEARALAGLTRANLKLMINDYNSEQADKRAKLLAIVRDLQSKEVPVDGVGHQFHLKIETDVADVLAALTAVEALPGSLVNHVTELDVSLYQDPESCFSDGVSCKPDYGTHPPHSVMSTQAMLYRALYDAFERPSVTSVTTWGFSDASTWLNTFPTKRTNRPLLFDVHRQPKWAFWTVVDSAVAIP